MKYENHNYLPTEGNDYLHKLWSAKHKCILQLKGQLQIFRDEVVITLGIHHREPLPLLLVHQMYYLGL